MKAVIYARFSSEKQTEQSIEGQVRVCKEYAEKNNYEVIRIYDDHATTGRNDHRPKFQQMLKDSAKREFEVVLVYKLDRFARNRYDSAYNKKILKKNGVKVVSATENISDNPEGILLESLLEGIAEYYSAELAQKVKRGIRESILKGQFLGGQAPFGYNIVNKKYVINNEEANIVRKIYSLYLSGSTIQEIINTLNKNHITNKKGGIFKFHQVHNILTKELYIGTLKGAGVVLENKIPSIIDKETFKDVQIRMQGNIKKVNKSDYILTGKLFCLHCDTAMIGTSGTGRNNSYFYYKCKKEKLTVRKDELENKIIEELKNFLSDNNRQKIIANKLQPYLDNNNQAVYKEDLLKKINKIDNELKNIANAILNGIINDEIKEKNTLLLKQKEDLIYEIDKINNYPTTINTEQILAFFKSLATSEELEDKAFLIKTLVCKVLYSKEKTFILLNLSPFNSTTDNKFNHEYLEIIDTKSGSSKLPKGLPQENQANHLSIAQYKGNVYGLIII